MQKKRKASRRVSRSRLANEKEIARKGETTNVEGVFCTGKQPKDYILNNELKDSGAKVIFDDKTLCSEFLREYVKLPYCENIQPEDIIDVSERYVPLFGAERDCDVVKRVNIDNNNPFFFVSLIDIRVKWIIM